MTRLLLILALVAGLLPAAGAQAAGAEAAGEAAPAPEVWNLVCPVTPEEPMEASPPTTEFEGKTIGFCCRRCRKKFEEDPERYRDKLVPREVAAAPAGDPAVSDPATDAPVTAGAAPPVGAPPVGAIVPEPPPTVTSYLGRFHVVVVHFPIALLLVALLVELGARAGRERTVAGPAVRPLLWLGAASAVVATVLGWWHADGAAFAPERATMLERHRWLGVAAAALAVGALALGQVARRRHGRTVTRAYWIALAGAAIAVGLGGHLGGLLVHGSGFLDWPW